MVKSNIVESEIATLQSLDIAGLRSAWSEAYGRPPSKRMRRDLLLLALAYRVQEQVEGALSKAARKHLNRLAHSGRNGSRQQPVPTLRLKPGTRLIRDWHGQAHTVSVTESGFEWNGRQWNSLSAIAREITGTRWSGPRFFGLRETGGPRDGSVDGT